MMSFLPKVSNVDKGSERNLSHTEQFSNTHHHVAISSFHFPNTHDVDNLFCPTYLAHTQNNKSSLLFYLIANSIFAPFGRWSYWSGNNSLFSRARRTVAKWSNFSQFRQFFNFFNTVVTFFFSDNYHNSTLRSLLHSFLISAKRILLKRLHLPPFSFFSKLAL